MIEWSYENLAPDTAHQYPYCPSQHGEEYQLQKEEQFSFSPLDAGV
jgi:hypothetical protein